MTQNGVVEDNPGFFNVNAAKYYADHTIGDLLDNSLIRRSYIIHCQR